MVSCKKKHSDGRYYGDTPGLSDTMMRKEAAEEITKALSKNGMYKLIFVVTVEAGRAREDDVSTTNLVLAAIHHKIHYGIIVNKVTKKFCSFFRVKKLVSEALETLPKKGL